MFRSSPAARFRSLLRCPSSLQICSSDWRALLLANVRPPCSFQSDHVRARMAQEVGSVTCQ
eukprot:7421789-Alexandrium_andersonii.AAC.1